MKIQNQIKIQIKNQIQSRVGFKPEPIPDPDSISTPQQSGPPPPCRGRHSSLMVFTCSSFSQSSCTPAIHHFTPEHFHLQVWILVFIPRQGLNFQSRPLFLLFPAVNFPLVFVCSHSSSAPVTFHPFMDFYLFKWKLQPVSLQMVSAKMFLNNLHIET